MDDGRGTGLYHVEAGGERIALRFDWHAIDRLATAWGDEWLTRIAAIRDGRNLADLGELLAAATDRPAAFWFDASPPINPTMAAVEAALTAAFQGHGYEKKTAERRRTLAELFQLLIGHGSPPAATRPNSGI